MRKQQICHCLACKIARYAEGYFKAERISGDDKADDLIDALALASARAAAAAGARGAIRFSEKIREFHDEILSDDSVRLQAEAMHATKN